MRLFTITFCLLLTSHFLYGQLQRTTNQSITAQDITSVNIQFNYDTEIERWPGGHIQIQTTVKMTNGNRNIIESLIKEKRYEVLIKENSGRMTLDYKDFKQGLRAGGYQIYEEINVKVFVPENIEVIKNGTTYTEDLAKG